MFWRISHKALYIGLGIIFILVGIGGFLFPFLPFWFSSDLNYLESVAIVSFSPPPPAVSPIAKPVNPNYPAVKNRLAIPSIGVNMPIFESANPHVLIKGGWIFPHTSTPDADGNTVIFGHRFRYLPPIANTFFHLDNIHEGDEFSITWQGVVYRYAVREIKVIEPTDLSVLAPSDQPIVTLVTCTPLFSTKQRLVVVGELLKN